MQLHNFTALKLKIRAKPDNRRSCEYIFAHRDHVRNSQDRFLRTQTHEENQSNTTVFVGRDVHVVVAASAFGGGRNPEETEFSTRFANGIIVKFAQSACGMSVVFRRRSPNEYGIAAGAVERNGIPSRFSVTGERDG